jgi:hypothetical protein
MTQNIDTIVVGGGQAGPAMSFSLSSLGREHVIIERFRLADSLRASGRRSTSRSTETGDSIQKRGVTSVPDPSFLGLRRMYYTVKSALLSAAGAGADAEYLAERICSERC